MATSDALYTFFEDQFRDTISPFFLYKDKQLLKEKRYEEFAHHQLKKADKIIYGVLFGFVICTYWTIISLINYGSDGSLFDLLIGLGGLTFLILGSIKAARDYYTIKSSMQLFLKLVREIKD